MSFPVTRRFFARGGRRNGHVGQGVGGIALTLIGFVVLYLVFAPGFSAGDANTGRQAVDAAAFQDGTVSPPAADAPTTITGEPTSPPTGEAPNVNAPTVQAAPSGQ
jgi:hypothetical protein